jgi:hypothetical protein
MGKAVHNTFRAQLCMVSKLDTSERRSEIPGKVQNIVLEEDVDQLCKK